MRTQHMHCLRLSAVAAGMLLAFGPASAQEMSAEELALLTRPESSVSVGAGYVGGNGSRFGLFTGQKAGDTDFLGNVDINRRDDASGTWLRLKGRNLGLDNRDLRFEHEQQGNWSYFLEYGEIQRHDPLTFTTPVQGLGSTEQTIVVGGPMQSFTPEVKRETTTFGLGKQLGGGLSAQVRFRNERKDGDRHFGFYDVGVGPKFAAEPIDQTTQEFEATLGYVGDRLQLSGGYLGSFFRNQDKLLHLNGALGPEAAFNSHNISLPPDNEAHNLNLAGAYRFSPTTRGMFKVSYTRGSQNDSFGQPSIFGHNSLDGRVDTTLVTVGLASRPTSALSLNANLRYEDRDDKTPRRLFFDPAFRNYTGSGFNSDTSRKTVTAKLDGTYRLPASLSLFGGVEWEERTRAVPSSRSLDWRQDTSEWSARIGLRRSLTDNLNGSLSYIHSDRSGGSFRTTSSYLFNDFFSGNGPNQSPQLINPFHWADRTRDKAKLSLDWSPRENLAVQVTAQYSNDDYDAIKGSPAGNDKGRAMTYSADATYSLSDDSKLSAWISQDDSRMRQRTVMGWKNSVPLFLWRADLRSEGSNAGLRAQVRATAKLSLDAELRWADNRSEFRMHNVGAASVPDISFRQTTLSLTADYALARDRGLKLQLVHDRWHVSDSTWTGEHVFVDGTTANSNADQNINFIGLSAYFKWI
ncbi:MtrB/PioB family decaheme-associated outer membrane protein [Aromatoleum toluvorans]|uniref:MtrB/PioB family decaheme-associated outer membrane protein n=1 Tax=Aromatoleum toluvorans TaxID=92002 RepID=A0ABX1Q4K9_9RHOO|nr:MtrB/PioB family decaheme-associated outer membrane protein [Aromatoleum toluvorans]NMG45291.1 MtrB/PioB family decaheme-associated outer membrane protein [Aromatoleum toluvorans]